MLMVLSGDIARGCLLRFYLEKTGKEWEELPLMRTIIDVTGPGHVISELPEELNTLKGDFENFYKSTLVIQILIIFIQAYH